MSLTRMIALTVSALATLPAAALAQPAPHPTRWYPGPTAEERQREERLDRRLPEVDFQAAPLQNVVDVLRQRGGVAITVDWDAIGPLGLTRESPVTYSARNLELRHVLTTLCESIRNDRRLVVDFDSLRITDEDSRGRRANMSTRSYPVGDILEFGAAWGRILERRYPEEITGRDVTEEIRANGRAAYETWLYDAAGSLCTTVTATVSPDAWEMNGGTATIGFYGPTLSIRSTYDVHAETVDLLRSIRMAIAAFTEPQSSDADRPSRRADPAPNGPAARRSLHTPFYTRAAADQRIVAALASPYSDALPRQATLEAALAAFRASAPIPTFVDWEAFEDCGLKRDMWIAVESRPSTAGQYLDAVLRCAAGEHVQLGAQPRPSGLRITTCESFRASTRVYPIADIVNAHVAWRRAALARDRVPDAGAKPDAKADVGADDIHVCDRCTTQMIATTLTQFVTPDAWEINGGVGTLTFVGPLLIVRTQYALQGDHIQQYLDGLAQSLQADLDGVAPAGAPNARAEERGR